MKFSVKSGQITDAKSIEINEMVYAQRRNGVDVIVLSLIVILSTVSVCNVLIHG